MGFIPKTLRRLERSVSNNKEICSASWAAAYLNGRQYEELDESHAGERRLLVSRLDLTLASLLLKMEQDLDYLLSK